MAQEDKIKGLQTITTALRERLDMVDERVNTFVKASEGDRKPHWAVGILTLIVLSWMGWVSLQVVSQGKKLTSIETILSPQEALKSLNSAVSPDPKKAKQD